MPDIALRENGLRSQGVCGCQTAFLPDEVEAGMGVSKRKQKLSSAQSIQFCSGNLPDWKMTSDRIFSLPFNIAWTADRRLA